MPKAVMNALVCAVVLSALPASAQLRDITINYPAKAPANWPLFLAKEGGYYQKYGLNAKLVFAVHPAGIAMLVSGEAQMTNYPMDQAMQAAMRDGSLVIMGSPLNRALFAMMTRNDIKSIRDLKGKKFGVSQLGDPPYSFALAILGKYGIGARDVEWIPLGTDGNGRVAALVSGRIDATMVPPPAYFKLEPQGFKEIANLADNADLYAPLAYVFKKSEIAANPKLPELMIKAQAEAIKRYYDDKALAIKAYGVYDTQSAADIERIYDHDRKANTYERVPYVLAPAVQYIIDHQADANIAAQMKAYDFRKVIDNSVVERLVKEHFFEQLFGLEVKAEQDSKARLEFK
jgi:ABC-type nitrate/sulfonate/bicarbonate transport system substrate-binding protein